jgi:hypothetical protein
MQQPPTQTLAKDTKIKQSEAIDGSNAALASDSVEWRDISTNHVDSNPKGSEISKSTIADEKTVSNRIKSRSGSSLTIETDMLNVTLVGVPKISVVDLVYAHHQDAVDKSDPTRFCAMFDIKNTSNSLAHWRSQRTKFIGSDGYTYDQSHISLDSSTLAPGCHTTQVKIEPGCRARVITSVEKLPMGTDVAKVIHTVPSNRNRPEHRLIFTL